MSSAGRLRLTQPASSTRSVSDPQSRFTFARHPSIWPLGGRGLLGANGGGPCRFLDPLTLSSRLLLAAYRRALIAALRCCFAAAPVARRTAAATAGRVLGR